MQTSEQVNESACVSEWVSAAMYIVCLCVAVAWYRCARAIEYIKPIWMFVIQRHANLVIYTCTVCYCCCCWIFSFPFRFYVYIWAPYAPRLPLLPLLLMLHVYMYSVVCAYYNSIDVIRKFEDKIFVGIFMHTIQNTTPHTCSRSLSISLSHTRLGSCVIFHKAIHFFRLIFLLYRTCTRCFNFFFLSKLERRRRRKNCIAAHNKLINAHTQSDKQSNKHKVHWQDYTHTRSRTSEIKRHTSKTCNCCARERAHFQTHKEIHNLRAHTHTERERERKSKTIILCNRQNRIFSSFFTAVVVVGVAL